MEIDVIKFREEWLKIAEKLEAISKIKKYYGDGQDFVGVEIDLTGITYKTETYYPGCGTDGYSFDVTWEELNEPLPYFEAKYAKEIEDKEREATERKLMETEAIRQREIREYLKLKEKYGDIQNEKKD